ncbi:MAG: SAM-dependent methyltransferase, partial [Lachnospiraceae bacterium]
MNLPNAFETKMKELLEGEFDDYITCFEEKRLYGLRVNTGKISVIENGFYYEGDSVKPSKHPYYFAGLYYLQEPSAMTPADRLPIEPGERVLDLCAAPGGKATEMGARLKGQGLIVANDISNSRAKGLLKNMEL